MDIHLMKLAAIPFAIAWLMLAIVCYRWARNRNRDDVFHSDNGPASVLLGMAGATVGVIVAVGIVVVIFALAR